LDIGQIIIWFVVFLLSLTVHECAHAWMAERVGDPTGRYLGRITLNPIPHIDIFGTVIFPLVAITTGGWMFGWAKPVPYNPTNLRNRKLGEILIAAAGPLSNVLLLIVFLVLAKILFRTSLGNSLGDMADPIAAMMQIGMSLNIILAVFNLIPIPPLDGSKILMNLLPDSVAETYSRVPDWAGFIVLFLLIQVGFTSALVRPIQEFVYTLLNL
jgi:Zn-dependent protease